MGHATGEGPRAALHLVAHLACSARSVRERDRFAKVDTSGAGPLLLPRRGRSRCSNARRWTEVWHPQHPAGKPERPRVEGAVPWHSPSRCVAGGSAPPVELATAHPGQPFGSFRDGSRRQALRETAPVFARGGGTISDIAAPIISQPMLPI